MQKIPPSARRESIDTFDDDDNINPNESKQSEEKIHRVYDKNNEKSKSFLDKVGDAIALLHGKTLAGLFRYVVNSLFNNGVRNVRSQSGENLSSMPATSSERMKDASLFSVSDSLSSQSNIQPKSELTIEAYKDFNSYLADYRQAVKQNNKGQLADSERPNATLYAEDLLKQVDSEIKSNPQYIPKADELERVAAAAALLGRKNPLAVSPTRNQFMAFERWHQNQSSDKKNQHHQTQGDLGEAKIYAEWFLENKSPTFHPESVEAKKEKSAKHLINNFQKISDSYPKKESASNINKKQDNQTNISVKNNGLSESDFYFIPSEKDISDKTASPEKKLSQRDSLLIKYKDLLGIDADEDMSTELIQALINKRENDNLNKLALSAKTNLEYDSDEDDGIPMDDDSDSEDDQSFFHTEAKFLEEISNKLSSNFKDGNSSPSDESLDSRMAEWKSSDGIIDAIRSENEEMIQGQRIFDENKRKNEVLTKPGRVDRVPESQDLSSLDSEFPLPTSLFVDKKLGPPPPPPPPRNQLKGGIGTNAIDVASAKLAELVALRNFPNVNHDQLSQALTGADADEDFDGLVFGAEDYFDSLASKSNANGAEKIKALTLAKIWEGAAQENRRLPGMKALKDYDLLNELLNSQKITKDFKD